MPAMSGASAGATGVHRQLAFIPKNCHTGWRLCSEQGISGGDLTIWARPSADADGLPGISAHL
ncbi:hypothetical protein N9X93_06225 [Alphaproteobacteria bacterium]|nr:hypothetical protein [Alphaproteobacteria bacterium]